MQTQQKLSSDFTDDRQGRKIIALVGHITAGLMPGTLSGCVIRQPIKLGHKVSWIMQIV